MYLARVECRQHKPFWFVFFSVLRIFSQNCSLKELAFKVSSLALKFFIQDIIKVGYASAEFFF